MNEALNLLIQQYRSKGKRKVFFELFTKPIEDVSFKDAYAELLAERRKDENLLNRIFALDGGILIGLALGEKSSIH